MKRIIVLTAVLAGVTFVQASAALADEPNFESTVTVVEKGAKLSGIPASAEFSRLEFVVTGSPEKAIASAKPGNSAKSEPSPSISRFENASDIADYSEILRLQN